MSENILQNKIELYNYSTQSMKIVTWNINGIRTFKGSIKNALDSLDADIICVQETKVTRDLLDERTAIVEGYNSYYSFSRGRSGYSGVATYCKDSATPFAAEEGLAGLMSNYQGAVGCYGDYTDFSVEELHLLDNEGRAVVTQHQITFQNKIQTLTVINVYCPRADPDKPERKQFKLQFYKLLQARAEAILVSGSHVIVLGDVNTSHRPIDHCDPNDIDHFEENPGRKWLNEFLYNDDDDVQRRENIEEESVASTAEPIHNGKFIDTFRYFHPNRANAFTCWSTLTGARQTNYGTRIDYIFSDLLLAKQQFVAADIMPEVEGSDHCPVWGQLSCSLLPSSKPPPLCTCYLPEFAGKQQKLSRFLVKLGQPSVENEASHHLPGSQEVEERRENVIPAVAANMSGRKRTLAVNPVVPKGKKSRLLKTSSKLQGSLLAFFKPKPTNAVPATEAPASQCERLLGINTREEDSLLTERNNRGAGGTCESVSPRQFLDNMEKDRDKRTQMESECLNSETSAGPSGQKTGTLQEFWKSVFHGPPPPPPCKVHREPCVLRTVRKEGPNMGRQFFVCARPQGHASNPEARCNFFAWVDHGK